MEISILLIIGTEKKVIKKEIKIKEINIINCILNQTNALIHKENSSIKSSMIAALKSNFF